MTAVNLADKLSTFSEPWQPRTVAHGRPARQCAIRASSSGRSRSRVARQRLWWMRSAIHAT